MKKLDPLVGRARSLLEEGRLLGLWKTSEEVADALNVPRSTFTSYTSGLVKDEEKVNQFLSSLQRYYDLQKQIVVQTQVSGLTQELRTAYLDAVEAGLWRTPNVCALKINVKGQTFMAYLRETGGPPGEQRKIFVREALKRIRKRLAHSGHTRDGPQPISEPAASAVPSSSASNISAPANGSENVLVAALADALSRTRKGETSYLVTSNHFRIALKALSKGDVRDTQKLLKLFAAIGVELTQRLSDVAEIPQEERTKLLNQLSEPIDLLYAMIDKAHTLSPSQAGAHRKRQKTIGTLMS